MNTTGKSRPRRVILHCGHFFYFKHGPPEPGDTVYCQACRQYRDVGPSLARNGEIYEAEYDYISRKIGNRYEGECITCHTRLTSTGYYRLRERMHQHHMRTHTNYGSDIQMSLFEESAPDALPPF